jgi:hypothetical protein
MTDLVVEFLKNINIAQLVAMGGMFWFFYIRLDKKIDRLETKFDKLSEKVEDIDRRLCRIEGSLSNQGHCLFSQKEERKID